MFAVLVALGARLLAGTWSSPPALLGESPERLLVFDAPLLLTVLALTLLRDVPFGASAAKWLLCLRVVGRDGQPLGLLRRILRAPLSLLPLPSTLQSQLGWWVAAYSPSRAGLVARTAITAGAAVFSITWAVETVRPSISRGDAVRLSERLAHNDPLLRRTLGEPLEVEVGSIRRRTQQRDRLTEASFALRIEGPRARQEMLVHARRVDGTWTIEELTDIEITAAEPDTTPTVARR
jgi:hypothetical protein